MGNFQIDIAVGSPYDGEEQSGIVYIFHGSANGISETPNQVKMRILKCLIEFIQKKSI
jgi:hypothetical protein